MLLPCHLWFCHPNNVWWKVQIMGRGHSEHLGVHKEYNIRMDIRKRDWEGVDWIHLALNRDHWWLLWTHNESLDSHKRQEICWLVSFSRRTLLHGVSLVVGQSVQIVKNFEAPHHAVFSILLFSDTFSIIYNPPCIKHCINYAVQNVLLNKLRNKQRKIIIKSYLSVLHHITTKADMQLFSSVCCLVFCPPPEHKCEPSFCIPLLISSGCEWRRWSPDMESSLIPFILSSW